MIGLRTLGTEATLQAARRRKAELKERLASRRSRLTLASSVRGAGPIGLLRQADRSFESTGARNHRVA